MRKIFPIVLVLLISLLTKGIRWIHLQRALTATMESPDQNANLLASNLPIYRMHNKVPLIRLNLGSKT